MAQSKSHALAVPSTNPPSPEVVRAHDVAMLGAASAYLAENPDVPVGDVLCALIQHVQGQRDEMDSEERAIVKDLVRRVFDEPALFRS